MDSIDRWNLVGNQDIDKAIVCFLCFFKLFLAVIVAKKKAVNSLQVQFLLPFLIQPQ